MKGKLVKRNMSKSSTNPFKKISTVVGMLGGLIGLSLGVWQFVNMVHSHGEMQKKIRAHLLTGDIFATQMEFEQAVSEYKKVLELDNTNVTAHQKIIKTVRDKLLWKAFVESGADIGLGRFNEFKTVPDSEIDAALTEIYHLKAIKPALKDDIELLLDEARIMKTNENRSKEAIKVLERARTLSPENPEVLAELGLLQAYHTAKSNKKIQGLDLIRRAIDLQPNDARYHFYLARSHYTTCWANWHNNIGGVSEACADEIREYHKAADLAVGQDVWSKQIYHRGLLRSMVIFKAIARHYGILTSDFPMSLEERITELDYLKTAADRGDSQFRSEFYYTGVEEDGQFLLATLCYAAGNIEKAERLMRELIERDRKLINYCLPWLDLYERILEKSGHNSKTLSEIREIILRTRGHRP
jgi:tetratricopeptide (TPR) repeat protein